IDADFLSELDPLECTHAQLAATAQWQRLRPLLRAIEVHLGERREAFLAWAGSVEPSRAEFLVPLADLEKGERGPSGLSAAVQVGSMLGSRSHESSNPSGHPK